MDDKELEQAAAAVPTEQSTDFLQEASEGVKNLANKFNSKTDQALSELKPSEVAAILARQKFDFLNKEIGAMVERGDVGTPVIDTKTGQPVTLDKDFVNKKEKIPEDLRKDM